ncbi:MAG: IS1595 family transposase [Hyphomonadaceae bacterium]|nr:IS1595 family transposase [Hyphomonadaceae bacterium]
MTAKSVLSAKHFHDEKAAFKYLEMRLWPDGPVCPKCGGEGYPLEGVKDKKGRVRLGLKKCRACRAQFTVRIGTIFEDSHAPLHLWLQAIALMAASKKGISSNQLHRTLGVTLKTAWFMSHRIRMAMAPGGKLPPMGGEGKVVEADETYFGKVENAPEVRADGKPFKHPRNRQRGPANRRPIVALVERGGAVRTFHVEDAGIKTIAHILRRNVDPKSVLHTDGNTVYRNIGKEFAGHAHVEHSMGEYVRWEEGGAVHNNSCENYFSVFKRGMKGVYQHCREKHLHRYLAEFDFRFNHRVALGVDDQARTDALIAGVSGKRLTYQTTDKARPAV